MQIASSFKIPNQAASIECRRLKSYVGHRDGVWEVSYARHGPAVIATASAGTAYFSLIIDLPLNYVHNSKKMYVKINIS